MGRKGETMSKRSDILVLVRRESIDNRVVSELVSMKDDGYGYVRTVVLDREHRRGPLDERTIISRAKMTANLLGCKLRIDDRPACVAALRMRCHCPVCSGAVERKDVKKAEAPRYIPDGEAWAR